MDVSRARFNYKNMQSVASHHMYSCSAYKHSSSSATALLLSSTLKWPRNASLLCHIASRPLQVRAWGLLSSDGTPGGNEGEQLVAEFMHHVISTRQSWPLEGRTPTPLMPPHTVIKVQMDALMRNDWPEENSGIRTAFLFSKPNKVEEMRVGQAVTAAKTWRAAESYLAFEQFVTHIKESQYAPMIYCLDWEVASSVFFHGLGDSRAVQAVKVTTENADGSRKEYTYTFCLEKILRGPYKNIWMVMGVKLGDYASA